MLSALYVTWLPCVLCHIQDCLSLDLEPILTQGNLILTPSSNSISEEALPRLKPGSSKEGLSDTPLSAQSVYCYTWVGNDRFRCQQLACGSVGRERPSLSQSIPGLPLDYGFPWA